MKERTLAAAAHSLDLPTHFPARSFASSVTDSRKVQKDDLFFALRGEKTDGHDHLAEVAERGALAAVVANSYRGPDYGLFLLRVPSVLEALQTMARKRIEIWRPWIVAVTGSVGKTTTKEFIATLLSSRFSVGKAPGNANSQVGVPLTILNLQGIEEALVLEMGMTEIGQIANLVTIAPPTLAVITKIGMAHAGNFASGIEGVALAKAEILSHPATRLAILGKDAWDFEPVRTVGSCERLTAAYASIEADYAMTSFENAWVVREKKMRTSPVFQVPFSASHFLEDVSIAIAVARSMGVEWEEMIPKLSSLQSTGGRFEKMSINDVLFINDAYNASPESVRAALDNLPRPEEQGRKIAILGGMTVDLGPTSAIEHREVARHALEKADLFFCYGHGSLPMKEVFETAGRLCFYTENMDELRDRVFSFVRSGDVVLVKGANRYAMWQLLHLQKDKKTP